MLDSLLVSSKSLRSKVTTFLHGAPFEVSSSENWKKGQRKKKRERFSLKIGLAFLFLPLGDKD